MNRLQTISQKHFISTMLEMLELWKETFPNCEKTSKYLIYFTGVVIGNKEREKNAKQHSQAAAVKQKFEETRDKK